MFETERLIVRPWRDEDLEPWIAMHIDKRVMEFFPPGHDRVRAQADVAAFRSRLERDGYGWWAVEVKGFAPFAGSVALQDVPFTAHFTPALEVGWRFAYDHWGRGYATEAARAVLTFAFNELAADEVVAMTAAINLRSQRVMQRLGMTRDPNDDFEHPRTDLGSPLRAHVLYRKRRAA
ncbi:MAG TPA: GNAT family N-acetyltransferase [Candidatus Baltobacteraceae bacterium]